MKIRDGNWSAPAQLFVWSPHGNNHPTPLLHNTSVFKHRVDLPEHSLLADGKGINIYSLKGAIIYSSPAVFSGHGLDARTALSLIRDASELLPVLLDNGHTTIAGRLAGCFQEHWARSNCGPNYRHDATGRLRCPGE